MITTEKQLMNMCLGIDLPVLDAVQNKWPNDAIRNFLSWGIASEPAKSNYCSVVK